MSRIFDPSKYDLKAALEIPTRVSHIAECQRNSGARVSHFRTSCYEDAQRVWSANNKATTGLAVGLFQVTDNPGHYHGPRDLRQQQMGRLCIQAWAHSLTATEGRKLADALNERCKQFTGSQRMTTWFVCQPKGAFTWVVNNTVQNAPISASEVWAVMTEQLGMTPYIPE